MPSSPDPEPFRQTARVHANALMSAFGAPAEILARAWYARTEGAKLARYVLTLEILVRRFLLALARTLHLAPPTPSRARAPRAAQQAPEPTPDTPSETWRGLSFNVLPQTPSRAHACRRSKRTRRLWLAAKLAKRLEAAIRVILSPERYARRLARKLAQTRAGAARIALAQPPRGLRAIDWFFAQAETHAETRALLDTG
jgi:hypothetical protein